MPNQRSHPPKQPAQDAEAEAGEIAEEAAWPGAALSRIIAGCILAVSLFWPRYFLNPAAPRHFRHAADAGVCVVLFFAASTLTLLVYALLLTQNSKENKKLITAVLNRAGIGAIFGTFVGLRLARSLLFVAHGASDKFPDFLGAVGNAITFMTLALIATAWPFALPVLRPSLVQDSTVTWLPTWVRYRLPQLTLPVLVGINFGAAVLAYLTYAFLVK